MTYPELKKEVEAGKLRYTHTGSRRGYVSRKGDPVVEPYKGKFGTGFVALSPRWDTTQYVNVEYFVR